MAKRIKKRDAKDVTIENYGADDPLLMLLKPIYESKGIWVEMVKRDIEIKRQLREKDLNRQRRYK